MQSQTIHAILYIVYNHNQIIRNKSFALYCESEITTLATDVVFHFFKIFKTISLLSSPKFGYFKIITIYNNRKFYKQIGPKQEFNSNFNQRKFKVFYYDTEISVMYPNIWPIFSF